MLSNELVLDQWGITVRDTSIQPSIFIGEPVNPYKIKKVIFNPPATIVFWEDKTKTVVKCMEDTEFDPDVGLAMCISKKVLGDEFKSTFRKYVNEYNAAKLQEKPTFNLDWNAVRDSMSYTIEGLREKVRNLGAE